MFLVLRFEMLSVSKASYFFIFSVNLHKLNYVTAARDRDLYACVEKLNATQKKALLSYIKTIIPGKEEKTYTIEQYNKELEEAEAEIDRGAFYTH